MTVSGLVRQSLHLLALWGVAVAQPLFDLIGRNPAFLTAHQFGRLEVVLLALGLAVVLPTVPALAVASIGMVNRRAGEIAHSGLMGALVALLVMQGLWRAVAWPEPLVTSIAIAAALVSISGYRRYAGVRSFLSLLSPTVLLFPALFLFASPAARLLDATDTAEPRNVVQKRLPHIVFLIFDELPTTVLMDQHGGIDGEKFPHFAGLAESAYWFRNATTVHTRTEHAVPAILTGMMPKLDRVRVPTVSDFPDNLFTWAARDYRILASEPLTDLCPIRICRVDIGLGVPANRTQRVLRDLATVYLHVVLPPSARDALPPINRSWADFGGTQFNLHENVVALNTGGRHRQVARFIRALDASPRPTLYFMHANLPHLPYEYLPGGERYFVHTRIRGLKPGGKLNTWLSDATALNDAYVRLVAQTRYVDKIVGDVISRLQEQGIYDDSLFIVTADHGVSIRANELRRGVSEANRRDIAGVPLFIKLPHQLTGAIVDRNVEIIDIMPSVSAVVGVPLSWAPDGISVFADGAAERHRKKLIDGHKLWDLPADFMVNGSRITDSMPAPLVDQELIRGLLGRPVIEFKVRGATEIDTVLRHAELFKDVDFEKFLPAHVMGDMQTDDVDLTDAVIAIAVNGAIRALTRAHRSGQNAYGFSQLLPASAFRPGPNSVAVYWVSSHDPSSETLAELVRID